MKRRYVLAAVLLSAALAGLSSAQPAKGAPRSEPKLKVGDEAPEFDLVRFGCLKEDGSESTDAKDRIKLSSFRGKKPVFVIFSSYT